MDGVVEKQFEESKVCAWTDKKSEGNDRLPNQMSSASSATLVARRSSFKFVKLDNIFVLVGEIKQTPAIVEPS